MKRTTLFIPESLERELQLQAQREGRPVAWVVREALTDYVASHRVIQRPPSFTGQFDSGRSDVAETHEDRLFAGLSPHGAERPPVARRHARSATRPRRARKAR